MAMAFVGFRCVGQKLARAFEDAGGFVEENDRSERAGSEFEQAVLSRVLFWPPVRRKVPRFRRLGGHGPFGERKNSGTNDGRDGTLRARVKLADGLDSVAEQFDADGARRFRRENIHDAAALRKLSGHFDHFRAGIADGAKVGDEGVEADFVVGFQSACEEFVAIVGAIAPERGGNRRDHEGGLAGGEAKKCGGTTFQNIRVRAARIPRQRIERRKNGDVARGKYRCEKTQSFGNRFGLFVGRDEEKCRAAQLARKIRREERFRGGLKARKLDFRFTRMQRAERAFHSGEAQQAFQTFANYGKNHRMAL